MATTRAKKTKYRLNKRGKILLIAVAAAIALIIVVHAVSGAPGAHLSILYDATIPDWVDVQYIDMDVTARKGDLLEEINGIVVHYVGNPDTTAAQNRSYFNNPGTTVFSHFIVGLEGEVIQCAPLYEKSVSSNERNRDTISIEVCHPDESGEFTQQSYDSLVRLCAWLSALCDFKEDDIIRHYDVTDKLCPKYYVEHEDAWLALKEDVTSYQKTYFED